MIIIHACNEIIYGSKFLIAKFRSIYEWPIKGAWVRLYVEQTVSSTINIGDIGGDTEST